MFVNLKTNNPAWLIEHDTEATYTLDAPGAAKPHHTSTPSGHFFATHREATADELEAQYGRPKAEPKPKAPPRAKAAAGAPKAARKGRKAAPAAKPPTGAPAASPASQSGASGAAGGGEPHGE